LPVGFKTDVVYEGVVHSVFPFAETQRVDIYDRAKERMWGGTVRVRFERVRFETVYGTDVFFSPRALEKIA